MIGTRILKIDSEIAEMLEVKVPSFRNYFSVSVPLTGANFDLSYLNYL